MFCPITGKQCDTPKNIHIGGYLNGIPNNMFICQNCVSQLSVITFPLPPKEESKIYCPTCKLTAEELFTHGKFGCKDCYTYFKQVPAVIAQLQEQAVSHLGKIPKAQTSMESLEKKLKTAIGEERYEDAAKIRDQINLMKQNVTYKNN